VSSQFDLLAASLRADAVDLKAFLEGLAVKLSTSFPSQVKVERNRALLGGKQRVRLLALKLGDCDYELVNDDGSLTATRRVVVRGIALRTESLSLEQWIDAVAQELVAQAGQTESDRVALERLLEA
jgi:hypothetical protein